MTTKFVIEQNIEILWYIFSFLPPGYGALLRLVSNSFKDAADTKYIPEYTDIVSDYCFKSNLIEQFRLGCFIDMYSNSRSKCLKLLRWSRKYYPDTDILLLYACTIDDNSLINSICNISQLPPQNINICLDYAFKNTNLVIIKRLYDYVDDLTIEHLLWLSIIHNQPEISRWLLDKAYETKTELTEEIIYLTQMYIERDIGNINFVIHYMQSRIPTNFTIEDQFMLSIITLAIEKAAPFYYNKYLF